MKLFVDTSVNVQLKISYTVDLLYNRKFFFHIFLISPHNSIRLRKCQRH